MKLRSFIFYLMISGVSLLTAAWKEYFANIPSVIGYSMAAKPKVNQRQEAEKIADALLRKDILFFNSPQYTVLFEDSIWKQNIMQSALAFSNIVAIQLTNPQKYLKIDATQKPRIVITLVEKDTLLGKAIWKDQRWHFEQVASQAKKQEPLLITQQEQET